MRTYELGKVENKRKGQAEKVVQVVKKFGPIAAKDICKKLKSLNKDCVVWHIGSLKKDGVLKFGPKTSKKEVK
jgi:hypothetical protein